MKILYLHGFMSRPGGTKPSYLRSHGHEVIDPELPAGNFEESLRVAQQAYDQGYPDVVVGSSRGGAVAMNIDTGRTPLVLIAPAWKRWGEAVTVKPACVILHSEYDGSIPIEQSRVLVERSGLPGDRLMMVGDDHRMVDARALEALASAIDRVAGA
jgi:hypothetical protein